MWRTYSWIATIANSPQNSHACWKISSLRWLPVVSCSRASGWPSAPRASLTAPPFVCRLHPFAGGGGVPVGLQAAGRVLAHRSAQHSALFLLQVFRLHHGEAASPAVLLAPHALRQNQPGLHQDHLPALLSPINRKRDRVRYRCSPAARTPRYRSNMWLEVSESVIILWVLTLYSLRFIFRCSIKET